MASPLHSPVRTLVDGYLKVLRLPLTAVEPVLRRGDRNEPWPPALAFDAFGAQVKGWTGSLLHDDELSQEAEVDRARVTQLRRAATLDAEAQTRREEADRERAERDRAAKQEAEQARRQAEERKQQLESQAEADQKRVQEQTVERKEQVAKTERARKTKVDKKARTAETKRLAEERIALQERKSALEAEEKARGLAQATQAARARRRS